jgi:DmsE family decaheme c-type cytochrome
MGSANYVGSQKCIECHTNQGHTFGQTLMGQIFLNNPRSPQEQLGCEACHGPGSRHVAAGGVPDEGDPGGLIAFRPDSPRPVGERNSVCLGCHESSARTHWRGSTHESRGLACTNCHVVMDKISPKFNLAQSTAMDTCFQCHKDRRAQLYRSSHMPLREGKVTCTDCHNPHGSTYDKLLKTATPNETCYRCHAERRGPFLWEHAPVREDCRNCHEPHGSMHDKLLVMPMPRLCQRCHADSQHPSTPQDPLAARFALNRGCENCHGGMIHGSNHPSGVRFHR